MKRSVFMYFSRTTGCSIADSINLRFIRQTDLLRSSSIPRKRAGKKKEQRGFYFANGVFFREMIYPVYNEIELIIEFVRITF
jgi:hypothetical protein